jgi:hypothetical protein
MSAENLKDYAADSQAASNESTFLVKDNTPAPTMQR